MHAKLLLALLGTAALALAAAPVKVLLVTGHADLPYHRWQETTACLGSILASGGRFDLRVVEEPRGLSAAALEGYDVLVVNYHGPRWPATAERAVEDFVRLGQGLFAFHHASYGPFFGHEFRDRKWRQGPAGSGWEEFPKMIGATWDPAKLGHARRGGFSVEWKDPQHPICRGLPASWLADDELYHRLTLFPGVRVLADALSPADKGGTGQREPQVWTNRYGRGRVVFTTLGHDAKAFYQPGMVATIARCVEWAATGDVSASGTGP